jgi:hypothetical protein
MNKCASCKRSILADARFCRHCGAEAASSERSDRPAALEALRERRPLSDRAPARTGTSSNRPQDTLAQTAFVLPPALEQSFTDWLAGRGLKPAAMIVDHGDALAEARQVLRAKAPQTVRYVCILGTWADVAPQRVPFELPGDPDEFCLSDAAYGCLDEIDPDDILSTIPVVPVGRIPSTDLGVIERLLCEPAAPPPSTAHFKFAVSADCWRDATQAIVESFASDASMLDAPQKQHLDGRLPSSALLTSPDWEEDDMRLATDGKLTERGGLLLFNVHGNADEPYWVGEGEAYDYVTVFKPGTIRDYANATLVTEACYGGAMGYAEASIVEHFFEHGGLSFVGSSAIAYGCSGPELAAADILARDYIAALGEGMSAGEALTHAKLAVLDDDPLADDTARKTVLSFNLYGTPWQTLRFRTSTAPAQGGSLSDRVRSRLDALAARPRSIDQIRQRYRQRLPVTLRSFLDASDQMMAQLRTFRDFSLIELALGARRGDLARARLDQVSVDGDDGWRLYCPLGDKRKELMIFLIGPQGQLKKTLMSKGQP